MAKSRSNFKRVIPQGTSQVNFNLKNENLDKVNYIALVEGMNKGEIYNEAVEKYCTDYEARNGKISFRSKKGAGSK